MTDADPTRRARVEAWNGWIDDHRSHGSVTRELMAAWDAAWTAASAALSAELAEAKAEVERLRKNRNECHRAEVHYLRRLTDAETERDALAAQLDALRAEPLRIEYGLVWDDRGSADVFPTIEQARAAARGLDEPVQVVRIETWPVADDAPAAEPEAGEPLPGWSGLARAAGWVAPAADDRRPEPDEAAVGDGPY